MGAEEWPRHDNKEWQKVIDRARALRWPKPHWTTSHPKLILECPEGSSRCKITAFSTGHGTESAAKTALKRLERCPHRDVSDALVFVDDHLTAADRLIASARALFTRGRLSDHVEELLALASESLNSAEQALVEEDFDQSAAELDALDHEVVDLPDDTSAESLLEEASTPLREAHLRLRELPKNSTEVRTRRERLDALTARRDELSELVHDRP